MCQRWPIIYPGSAKLCVITKNIPAKDNVFRITTTGRYRVARLYLDKRYTNIKLSELRYLLNMFHVGQNQQTLYILALPDVMTYRTVPFSSPSYVAPAPNISKLILYEQLFDELKRYCKQTRFLV